jgi:glycosyltransferase involved in cell wall biosynthesis
MSTQPPLKIVRIIGRLNVGGPARQACLLHERLRPEFETVLISGRPDEGEEDMSYLLSSAKGVHWVDSMSRPVRFLSDLQSLLAIYRILRREKPHLVHTHTAKAGTLGRVAALFACVPVRIHTFHGHVFAGYFGRFTTWFYLTIERILAYFTMRVVTVSEGQAEELAHNYQVAVRSKIQVIRNGFEWKEDSRAREEIRAQLGIKPDQVAVLWIGRMVPIKGLELLADVIKMAQQNTSLLFLVAGDGPERARFEESTRGCSNVHMLGWYKDVSPLLKASDTVLLTSINEGTPTSLIEAMFAGRPFVATDAGGTSDLAIGLRDSTTPGIRRAENGFIVERKAEAIVDCLAQVAKDPAMCTAMGQRGKEHATKNWSADRLLREMKQLYLELTDSAKARAQSV